MVEGFETLYVAVVYLTLIGIAGLEAVPRLRLRAAAVARRWPTNIGLFAGNLILQRLFVPVTAVGVALLAGPGPFAAIPGAWGLDIVLGVLALDLWSYVQHRLLHQVPPLWRLHQVHHSDVEVDFTTTERHHPFEAAVTLASQLAVIYLLAIPPAAVALFSVAGGVVALVSHANLRIPHRLDRAVSRLVVTPGFHFVHHSAARRETDSNYGLIFTVWDRLFGTLVVDRSPAESAARALGLDYFRAPDDARLVRVLGQPFRDPRAAAAPAGAEAWTGALIGIGAGLLVLLGAFGATALEIVEVWRSNAAYQHSWAILPTFGYLAWRQRAWIGAATPGWSLTGIGATIVCGGLWLAADLMNLAAGRQMALVAAVPGVVLAAVGWAAFRRLLPYLALLAMLAPAGDVLLPPLKQLTLASAGLLIPATGLPFRADGFAFVAGGLRYVVIDECAGLSYFLLALFIGWTFGLLLYRSFWRVAGFGLLGAGLAVMANNLRILGIVWVDRWRGTQMELSDHLYFQWVALALIVIGLMAAAARLRGDAAASHGRAPEAPAGAAGRSLVAPLAAALLAAVAARTALAHVDAAAAPAAGAPARIESLPDRLAGWERGAAPASWAPKARADLPAGLAAFERDGRRIGVFTATAPGRRDKVTGYAVDLIGDAPWVFSAQRGLEGCGDAVCGAIRVTTSIRLKSREVRRIYHAYAIGGTLVASPLALQARRAWTLLAGGDATTRVFAIASDGADGLSADAVTAMMRALAAAPAGG